MERETLRRTPLYDAYRSARLIAFGNWELPVSFTGVLHEHHAVRTAAGMFDISHMGRIVLEGPDAAHDAERLFSCDVASMPVHTAKYAMLCDESGGIRDDVIVYKMGQHKFSVVLNAANTQSDQEWICAHLNQTACIDDTDHTAMIALQGPRAIDALLRIATPFETAPYRVTEGVRVHNVQATIATTGYTGERGVEMIVDARDALPLWTGLLDACDDIVPAGLGARDILRIEAGLPLYGHELTRAIRPIEARLDRFVPAHKKERFGASAQSDTGKRLVGIATTERGPIPRAGSTVHDVRTMQPIGVVTSGCSSPSTASLVAFAYVPYEAHHPGTEVVVSVRGREMVYRVVPLPFYRRKK
jgi:aminomethyltransferase